MIVARDQVAAILAGSCRTVETCATPPTPGTIQAVQTAVGKHATCTVHIDSVARTANGWSVAFHLAHPNPPRLLARGRGDGHGYTADPKRTIDIEAGETPSAEQLASFAADAALRRRHARDRLRSDQELLDAEARIVAYRREAAWRRIDIRSELRLLKRLQGQGRDPTNPLLAIRRRLDSHIDRAA